MSLYNVREHTAKTVNEELHSLEASCQRISKRLVAHKATLTKDFTDSQFNDWQSKGFKLANLLDRQQAILDSAIVAAKEGRRWRHRSHTDHMNKGLDNSRVHEPQYHMPRDNKVFLIPGELD